MYCHKCGNKISDDSKFCDKCGTVVTAQNSEQTNIVKTEAPAVATSSEKTADVTIEKTTPSKYAHLLKADEEFGDFITRAGAYLIDLVIGAYVPLFMIGLIIGLANPSSTFFSNTATSELLAFAFLVAYHTTCLAVSSTTVGKHVLGLRVVDTDGKELGFWKSLGRSISYFFSSLLFGLGFFAIAWSDDSRGWHDDLAGTLVICKKSKKVTAGIVFAVIALAIVVTCTAIEINSNSNSQSSANSTYGNQ